MEFLNPTTSFLGWGKHSDSPPQAGSLSPRSLEAQVSSRDSPGLTTRTIFLDKKPCSDCDLNQNASVCHLPSLPLLPVTLGTCVVLTGY